VTGFSVGSVLTIRNAILQRNAALGSANKISTVIPTSGTGGPQPVSFTAVLTDAMQRLNQVNAKAGALTEAYERGAEIDIAKVMLARQTAGIGFEATLQVRNKLLSAYKDVMGMAI
jgi:flagellar hook-basal body complex protein FliE